MSHAEWIFKVDTIGWRVKVITWGGDNYVRLILWGWRVKVVTG